MEVQEVVMEVQEESLEIGLHIFIAGSPCFFGPVDLLSALLKNTFFPDQNWPRNVAQF